MPYYKEKDGTWWYRSCKQRTRVGIYNCMNCGEEFHRLKSQLRKNHYCSKKCSNEVTAEIHSKERKGKGNPMWNGGRKRTGEGYIKIYFPNHPYKDKKNCVYEHRFKMEKKLKRYLFPFETVHHKNGKRDDNRINNLELFISKHPAGQRPKDLVKWAKKILRMYNKKPYIIN